MVLYEGKGSEIVFYLLLAVFCSAVVSLFMRLGERYQKNHISMLAVNYVVCVIMALFFTGGSVTVPKGSDGMGFCIGLGIVQGVLYLLSFLLLQLNISKNGVVLSTTFMRLGLLVPTCLSVLVFRELPAWTQFLGFAIAIAAILLISLEKGNGRASFKLGLICILMCSGVTDFLAKLFEEFGVASLRDTFLLFAFIASCVLCIAFAWMKKQRLCLMDILFGVLIGVPNYFSARFILYALRALPGIVVYPTHSISTIIVVCLGGMVFFRERLSKKQLVAVFLILVAVGLLNI